MLDCEIEERQREGGRERGVCMFLHLFAERERERETRDMIFVNSLLLSVRRWFHLHTHIARSRLWLKCHMLPDL